MNILLIGSGGREHAIVKALKKSPMCGRIYALPGNGGIAEDAECVPISATDIEGIVGFAKTHPIDFAAVIPDDPLAAAAVSAVTNALSGESFTEVFIILIVVLLNAVLGVVQESKAEAAIEALQTMTAAKCKVLRGGHQIVVESSQLVPGDVVVLEAGDAIPAVNSLLGSGSSVYGGHEAAYDAEFLIENLGDRSKTVGCARCVGDDVLTCISLVVYTIYEHWSSVL